MKTRPSPRYALALFGAALFVSAVIAGTAFVASRELSQRALLAGEQQAARFINGAQAAFNRSVLGVDVLLAGVGDLIPEPKVLQTAEGRARVARLIEIGVTQNALVRKMALVSPAGNVLVSSEERGRGDAGRSRLPADYLAAVLAPPIASLVISDPAISPSTSNQVLYFGRALRLRDDGRVAAVAEVDLGPLMNLLVQGADIEGLEVTLERADGALLASIPTVVVPRGTVSRLAPVRLPAEGARRPSASAARVTGTPALVAVRATLQTGVRVTASIPLAGVLADSQRQRNNIFGFALLLIAATFAGATVLHLRIQRQWLLRAEQLRSRATLDQALESMQVGFVLLDADDRILVWNRTYLELFPWAGAFVGHLQPFGPILDYAAGYRRTVGEGAWAAWRAGGDERAAGQFESELTLPDGRVIRSTKNRTPDGGMVCIYEDVTEKKERTAEILDSRAQLQATLDALPDTLFELDGDGVCRRIHSPQGLVAAADAAPTGKQRIQDLLPPAALSEVMRAVRDAETAGISRGRHFEVDAGRSRKHFEISVSRKIGEGSTQPGYVVLLRDITQAEQAARDIRQLAFYDALTGLPNRRYLLDLMASAVLIDPESGRCGAVLFLDLDNFKTLNDALGHAIGDAFLKEVAIRIGQSVPPGGVVARLGGDEFVVVLEGLGPGARHAATQAREVGEQIIDALDVPFALDTQTTYQRACSIGVTLFDGGARSIEELLKQADIAMYVAKTAGGNCLRFFEPEMQAAVAARSALENEIREALSAREFVLHYQSQVDRNGIVIGAEALVRWHHPRRGLVLPGDFIAVAEDSDLIVALGTQVLEMACMQLAVWRRRDDRKALALAVNVSARQFRRDDFAEQVQRILEATGADPSMLKLELTESLLQSRVEETIRKMHHLKAIGVRFSMDDFGTGYSSLSYLTQLPLDQVKVDKYFVGNIGRDPKIEMIVQTIIGMARNLEVELIAEGVETEAQLRFLRDNGCLRYQGYLFSRPRPIDEFQYRLDAPPGLRVAPAPQAETVNGLPPSDPASG